MLNQTSLLANYALHSSFEVKKLHSHQKDFFFSYNFVILRDRGEKKKKKDGGPKNKAFIVRIILTQVERLFE